MDNFSGKTYNELIEIKNDVDKNIKEKLDDCIKNKMPWNDAIHTVHDDKVKSFIIDKHIRCIKEPTIIYGKKWKGTLISMDEFIKRVQNNDITDSSHFGFYATETSKSDIEIYPSDILYNIYRNDFSHVILVKK